LWSYRPKRREIAATTIGQAGGGSAAPAAGAVLMSMSEIMAAVGSEREWRWERVAEGQQRAIMSGKSRRL